ncbi:hypothetical protein [Vibrio crassostreae]|uniref:hypothetical protein n=1 Tax=Vibrio crassostreae TaxID=246167 RepID=UPI001B305EBD|nr:hypothetical protein [Vibrio crassostreae]
MIKNIFIIATLTTSFITSASELTESECAVAREKYRIEPFTVGALESAIGMSKVAPSMQKCVYPELNIENINVGEIETAAEWEESNVGVAMWGRTKYSLGEIEIVQAVIDATKGYSLIVGQSVEHDQVTALAIKDTDRTKTEQEKQISHLQAELSKITSQYALNLASGMDEATASAQLKANYNKIRHDYMPD